MSTQKIRPYEMQIWSLSDKYIMTIDTSSDSFMGQIFSPEMNIKDDGTGNLKFSVPMYIRENGVKKENPVWFNLINGQTLHSLRKLKVIFEKNKENERVFEFVVKELKESHSKGELVAEITAESLAFQELGKIGYKIVLSQAEFEIDYDNWFETKEGDEPIASLNYWCDKVFSGTDWNYKIEMDWSSYDGIIVDNYSSMSQDEKDSLNMAREASGLRRLDKIYDEEYISSWRLDGDKMVPRALEPFREKARIVEAEKSNIYNITQTLAETFEVFCKYVYYYDDNYHIIGKECVFYNNFIKDFDNRIDILYPYNSSEISRTMDSTDVTTKMYVVPIEDDSISNGYITIADASANRSGEDYIFNFDYLYQTGAITEEQYQAVDLYERQMFIYNETLKPLSDKIAKSTIEKNDLSAEQTLLTDAQSYAIEQMNKAKDTILAIVGDDGTLEKDVGKPDSGVFLLDSATKKYYVNITQEGVNVSTLKLFRTFKSAELTDEIVLNSKNFEYDEAGNLIKIINIELSDTTSLRCYMTYKYSPKLHWQKVYDTYARRLNNDKTRIQEIENELSTINENLERWNKEYEKTLKLKEDYINDFNVMMGTAIREGSWQAESYKDFGDKNIDTVGPQKVSSNYLTYLWDKEYFEDEQLAYYESGINQDKIYYPVFDITNDITKISPHKDELCLFYGEEKTAVIASQLTFGFYKKNDNIRMGLLVIDNTILEGDLSNAKIGYITSSLRDDGSIDIRNTILVESPARISEVETYDFVYPRIKINSTLVKTGYEDISIKVNDTLLEKYKDYYALSRDEALYLTIKPQYIISQNTYNIMYETYYVLSNAAICLYLDALEVSKNSAFPQTSYDVKISYLDTGIISNLYDYLGVLTNINDTDLKFENVQGYISEIKMDLNSPWKDSITIKNYKTKFEDLFTRIVASSEQMKTNSYLYDTAASAFNSSGSLKVENIQDSLTQADLIYSFMNGELTITQDQGIWGRSDKGVVAFRGGGIFCATNVDENGNWIWNTGITPSGINAALLTAGQIDTNRIRIFSGDNVRFQMNGDGLFAYRYSDITGESNPNEYVVHNSEGLFLTNKILEGAAVKDIVNLVEVSWEGLIIRNKLNEKVFYADTEGNLTLKGHIEAESGTIGGWEIQKDSLSSGDTGMASGGTTIPYKAFWAGENKGEGAEKGFYVMSDGTMKATGVTVEGTINATGGTIGNVTIQEIEDSILGIEVIENNGNSFKYGLNEENEYEIINSSLEFTIVQSGLTSPIYTIKKSLDGAAWHDTEIVVDENNKFTVSNTEMKVNETSTDVLYLKVIATSNEKDYEYLVTLYNLYDGKKGNDGIANFITISASSLVFLLQSDGITYLPSDITITASLSGNLLSSNNRWYFNGIEQVDLQEQSEITIVPEDIGENESLVVKCENSYSGSISTDTLTLAKLRDGKDGTVNYTVLLSNDSLAVACDALGEPYDETVSVQVYAYRGTELLSTNQLETIYYTIECDNATINDDIVTIAKDKIVNRMNYFDISVTIHDNGLQSVYEKKFTVTKVIPEEGSKMWLELNGDTFYKFYTAIDGEIIDEPEDTGGAEGGATEEETTNIDYTYSYSYNPVSIQASIAYSVGLSEKTLMPLPDDTTTGEYFIGFFCLKNGLWEKLTNGISLSTDKFTATFTLSELDNLVDSEAAVYNKQYVKIAILKTIDGEEKEFFSEIKQIVWGTSDDAAKFDFVASGAYWTVHNLNYTFNSEGFSIIKRENESPDSARERIFYVDDDGNVYLSGIINAKAGKLGAWDINNDGIYTTSAGLYAAVHSIYYDVYNDTNAINFFTAIGEELPSSEQEAAEKSKGSELVFYAGAQKINRNAIYENHYFRTDRTYAFTVLSDGLVYVDRLMADGTIYSSGSFNVIGQIDDEVVLDYHILGNTNLSYNIFDKDEILFLGVGKDRNDKYGLMVMSNGVMYAGAGAIRLATEGLFITKNSNKFASGFNIINENSQDTTPIFWVNTTAASLSNIGIENTDFLIQSDGLTYVKNLQVDSFSANDVEIDNLTINNSFIINGLLEANTINDYIDFYSAIHLNGNALVSSNIILQENLLRGNTFSINDNTGISTFNTIQSSNIISSIFTQDRISSVNGSMIIMNSFRLQSWNRNSNSYEFLLENDADKTALQKGYVFAIEKGGIQNRYVVTSVNDTYIAESIDDDSLLVEEKDIILVHGVPETSIYDISFTSENTIEFKLKDYATFNKIISILDSDSISYSINNITLTDVVTSEETCTASFSGNLYQEIRNSSYLVDTEYYYNAVLKYSIYDSFSKIYLRAINDYPEITFYRSNFIEDNTPITSQMNLENLNSLILKIGDLSSITDNSFGGALSGNGLYAENVYLKGSLVLPKAGITDTSNSNFNFDEWNSTTFEDQINSNDIHKGNTAPESPDIGDLWLDTSTTPALLKKWDGEKWENIDKVYSDTSPIRIWAGARAKDRVRAPFIVTENGFVYASQGVFKGSVYATDGIFSGFIESTGVLLDEDEDFFIARKKISGLYNPTDYLINFSYQNGLEVYDNGFVVFSGQPRTNVADLYLDYDALGNPEGYNYQLPYVTILEKEDGGAPEDTLITKNLNVFKYDNMVQENDVIVGDFFGVEQSTDFIKWYSYQNKRQFEPSGNWKNYYSEDIKSNVTDYVIKINRRNRALDFGPDENSLNISLLNGEIDMKKNNNSSNLRITSMEDGFNFYVE